MTDTPTRIASACTIPPKGWWCSREAGHEGPCAARPVEKTYRGWSIHYDPPPIPTRDFDWRASGPNFDASYEGPEDGWVSNGQAVEAASYPELLAEIDEYIEAHEGDKSCHPAPEQGK